VILPALILLVGAHCVDLRGVKYMRKFKVIYKHYDVDPSSHEATFEGTELYIHDSGALIIKNGNLLVAAFGHGEWIKAHPI
jgi:hypothetical protein